MSGQEPDQTLNLTCKVHILSFAEPIIKYSKCYCIQDMHIGLKMSSEFISLVQVLAFVSFECLFFKKHWNRNTALYHSDKYWTYSIENDISHESKSRADTAQG